MNRIYLDHAASTPMAPEVLGAMMPFLLDSFGNPSSTHAHGRQLKNAIEGARRTIATELGAQPAEIIFTSGGTESDNLALRGMVETHCLNTIISSPIEHHAVTHTIEQLEQEGKIKAVWLDVLPDGSIDLDQLRRVVLEYPGSLVSLMHSNNELGTMIPIQEVGEICRGAGVWFHSDTVQTMTNVRYDLAHEPIDLLTASAHKFNGPKGIGFLYVRKGLRLDALLHGGSQERGLRPGTENAASIVGMAEALKLSYSRFQKKQDHLRMLRSYMWTQLRTAVPEIKCNGAEDDAFAMPTVLNVTFPDHVPEGMLLFQLDLEGISVSGGSACQSGAQNGSHVLHGIGKTPGEIGRSVRFSFGWQNTKEEIDIVVGKLHEIVASQVGRPQP